MLFDFFTVSVDDGELVAQGPAGSRVASSAGKNRASHTLWNRAGRGGDGSQELQEIQKPVAPLDIVKSAQGPGEGLLAERRHETGASLRPEGRVDEGLQPPLAPMLQRPPVNGEQLAHGKNALRTQAVVHGGHEHDDEPGVNLAAEEPDRRRRYAAATALLGAAETAARVPLGAAARFSIVIGAMKFAFTMEAPLLVGRLGKIIVDLFEQLG